MSAPSRTRGAALAAAPFVFVLLWSTGFVGAKYGLPYAEPFTFLALRLALAGALLAGLAVVLRADWPRSTALSVVASSTIVAMPSRKWLAS